MEPIRPLTKQQQELAEAYMPLARSIALRSYRHWRLMLGVSWKDFVSLANLALVTAARDYKQPSPIAFATFARWRIVGELAVFRKVQRNSYPHAPKWFVDRESQPTDRRRWGRTEWHPVIRPDPATIDANAILRRLPKRNAQALRLTALEGLTYLEAARIMGCTTQTIYWLIKGSRQFLE